MRIFRSLRQCYFLVVLAIFLPALPGCSAQVKFEKQEITIKTGSGNIGILAEIAKTDAQRQQGYMFRKEIREGEGMLFIFEHDQFLSFWMKNTLVPLSIAYIAHNGVIIEIFDMEPGNLEPVFSSFPARYALEVPLNWFNQAGIKPWDRLDTLGLP